jgi:DNA-binding LacI/PurR family transcriptional regulator
MTSSDRTALGVMTYCAEKGFAVPRDVSVIGYDNLYPAEDVLHSLSTVDHPISLAGRVGTGLLADLIEGKEKGPVEKWLDTSFVVRESTAKAGSWSNRGAD